VRVWEARSMDVDPRPGHSRGFVGLIAGVLILGAAGYPLAIRYVSGPAPERVRSAAFLNRVAAEINPMFPRKIDAETEITSVSALEGVFIYHYRFVNVAVSQVDAGVLAELRPTVTKSSCANPATLNNFIKKDITLRYFYSDKAGTALASFDITRADCGV
jgi:hypothetical protein